MPTERQHLPRHTGSGTDRAGLMSLKKQLSSLIKFNSARLLPDGPLTRFQSIFMEKLLSIQQGHAFSLPPLAHTTPSGQSHPPSTASLRSEIHKCFSPIHGTNSRSHWQEMQAFQHSDPTYLPDLIFCKSILGHNALGCLQYTSQGFPPVLLSHNQSLPLTIYLSGLHQWPPASYIFSNHIYMINILKYQTVHYTSFYLQDT